MKECYHHHIFDSYAYAACIQNVEGKASVSGAIEEEVAKYFIFLTVNFFPFSFSKFMPHFVSFSISLMIFFACLAETILSFIEDK